MLIAARTGRVNFRQIEKKKLKIFQSLNSQKEDDEIMFFEKKPQSTQKERKNENPNHKKWMKKGKKMENSKNLKPAKKSRRKNMKQEEK